MSSGGRVFPSITGGGLTRAGEAIFEAALARSQRDLQERQLSVQERAGALNQFVTLANFLPVGARLGSLGTAGMDLFTRAFGMPADGLEDLDLNPETLETAINAAGTRLLDADPNLLLPSVRARLGLEPDADVAATRGLEARLQFEALTSITNDPALKSEFVSRALGREPVTLTIPGRDGRPARTISFDSTTAANIYAQFLLAQDRESFELSIREGDDSAGLVEEIQEAVRQGGTGFNVSSTAILGRVIPTYNQAVQAGDLSILESFLDTASEGESLAMQYLVGSIKAGETTFLEQLREQAPQLANFVEISNAIREGIGPEAAAEIMPGITEALGGMAGTLRNPLFGGLEFTFGGDVGGTAATQAGTLPGFGNVPREILIQTAQELFNEGTKTREELTAVLGADVVNAALGTEAGQAATTPPAETRAAPAVQVPAGGFDPEAVPQSVRRQAIQLNTLLRNRDRGITGRGATASIERLTRQIREAVNLPDAEFALETVQLREARGNLPVGGIDPGDVPPEVRGEVEKLNGLITRRARTQDTRAQTTLDTQITRQRRIIATAIAGIGGK